MSYQDPFKTARAEQPAIQTEFDGDPVAMILGFKPVREAARDWEKFSSDAPFRVPIPREEDVRTVRQYPLEVDPPFHAEYRAIAEPFFKRPLQPEYIARMGALIEELLKGAIARPEIEIVREFAIPLQSRALTYLLNMPESEAEVWIQWGTHVFRDASGVSKGAEMEAYSNQLFDAAEANPGDDFFSALTRATFEARPLTRDEMLGYANIAFAGGPRYGHWHRRHHHRLFRRAFRSVKSTARRHPQNQRRGRRIDSLRHAPDPHRAPVSG